LLVEHQRLATSGARAVLPFRTDSQLRLAIPQLAVDIPGTPPYMNGGDSNIDMLLYRWAGGRFIEDGRLPVPGGEDAVFFRIGDDEFLATASIRTGSGPYDLNVDSILYRRAGDAWVSFQAFPTFAAKQWHYFSVGDRHFLALAQGVRMGWTSIHAVADPRWRVGLQLGRFRRRWAAYPRICRSHEPLRSDDLER